MVSEQFHDLCPGCESYGVTDLGNPYGMKDDEVFIGLTQGQIGIIDASDFTQIAQHRWYAHKNRNTYYAEAMPGPRGKREVIKMHHVILGNRGMIDHCNKNGLDNRKCNLRRADHTLNGLNRRVQRNNMSGVANVFKRQGRWMAQLRVNGIVRAYKGFDSLEEASAYVERMRADAIKAEEIR